MYYLQWQDDVVRHGGRLVNRVAQENGWFESPVFWVIAVIAVLAFIVCAAAAWQSENNKKK